MTHGAAPGLRRVWMGIIVLAVLAGPAATLQAGDRPLSFSDLMAIRQIESSVISENGAWIAYALRPDRGDGGATARAVDTGAEHWVPLGSGPVLSWDGSWMAATLAPTQEERDRAETAKTKGKLKRGLALLNTATGEQERIEKVASFAFSADGHWLATLHERAEDDTTGVPADSAGTGETAETEGATPEEPGEEAAPDSAQAAVKEENLGALLVLRDLATGRRHEIPYVADYVFDEPSRYLAYAVAEPGGEENGLYLAALGDSLGPVTPLHQGTRGRYTHPVWAKESSRLAFLAATDDETMKPGPAELWTWEPGRAGPKRAASAADAPEGWTLPSQNDLRWTRDGRRLFFGFRPADAETSADSGDAPYDPYDLDAILARREVDVWSWNDSLIVPQQKKQWQKDKDRTYRAVYHRRSGRVTPLSDPDLPEIRHAENLRRILGFSDRPYQREITWEGRFRDAFLVDLGSGERTPVIHRLPEQGAASLSPGGRYVAWFEAGHWHLYDAESAQTRNLTAALAVSFADEDHDYPSPPPGYGVAGWIEGDRAVLIYDKYDLWRFPTAGGEPVNLTGGEGRRERRQFRVVDLDPDREEIGRDETLLLRSFHEPTKNGGFYRARAAEVGVAKLVEGENRYRFLAKAKDADRILFTRESYTEFPDLWTAGPDLAEPVRQSDANPGLDAFAWGEAELVEWTSADGIPLQGVLIKPGRYEPGKRYPVLVYVYRLFSQRLHWFNEPVVNHRPSFPVYASHGYAVFLPDIRYTVGHPGLSAVNALVPAVRKLVDMGIADPRAVGLHGHSWGGYETAQVVTETDIFAAAAAGAPVANMTSAYSGLRLESGLARQFQYETGQSRIGASLDEALPLYIENSPVFGARRIKTPLLIQVGDEDGAVPWQQGIELYLALRRLGKPCHMLQYRGEPHHLQKYPNKLDYSIKMKEFFDHYLKGEPAPAWMTEGVPYRGD